MALAEVFNQFLSSMSTEQRIFFMRRYWYLSPIKEIALNYGIGESKVKMSLLRIEYNDVCKSEKEIDKPLGAPVK